MKKTIKNQVEILIWYISNSCEALNKLKSPGFRASSLSTYDFSTLYTTLPHNCIKDKLVDLKPPSHSDKDRTSFLNLDKHKRENGTKGRKKTQFSSLFYVLTTLLPGCYCVLHVPATFCHAYTTSFAFLIRYF